MYNDEILKVNSLSFSYGDTNVFENINLAVHKGDFAAIIGSNGSGKSTLVKLILDELTPPSGGIEIFGLSNRHFKQWPRIGYVPQNGTEIFSGFPASAIEVVTSNLYSKIGLFKLPSQSHKAAARAALMDVGMEQLQKKLVGQMSGGQQQRVLLARALVNNPDLLLLDEPTTGLDGDNAESFYKLLSRLNQDKGLTILMITHDITRAANYVSRVMCLNDGSLVELSREQLDSELAHKHRHPHHSCACGNEPSQACGHENSEDKH